MVFDMIGSFWSHRGFSWREPKCADAADDVDGAMAISKALHSLLQFALEVCSCSLHSCFAWVISFPRHSSGV